MPRRRGACAAIGGSGRLALAYRLKRRIAGVVSPREPDLGPEVAAALRDARCDASGDVAARALSGRSRRSGHLRISGTGLYLRTDYWVQITSGGSYGHTCYVAKELAARTERFVCLMGSHYRLLDDFGLDQVVLPPASHSAARIRSARGALALLPAAEGRVSGAAAGLHLRAPRAWAISAARALSRELGIPYIVEYNGSEISMTRSFGGSGLALRRRLHPGGRCGVQAGDDDHRRVGGRQGLARRSRRRRGQDSRQPERRRP